jgi:hypothetical protein
MVTIWKTLGLEEEVLCCLFVVFSTSINAEWAPSNVE